MLLRLRAEMKLPAWIEWRPEARGTERAHLRQRAVFIRGGLAGRAYWWSVAPFHASCSHHDPRDAQRPPIASQTWRPWCNRSVEWLALPPRIRWSWADTLDERTDVGLGSARRSPMDVPISNACTQLQRVSGRRAVTPFNCRRSVLRSNHRDQVGQCSSSMHIDHGTIARRQRLRL